jgi:tetraacyldisaccharide 4'-kinase
MNFFKPNFWDKKQISFFSILLFPISLLIIFLNFVKRLLIKNKQSSIPVICVGNIYLGGTGKTPLCNKIFSILKEMNMNPAFIRKSYDDFEDEANLQKEIGPIYQNRKRFLAIEEAKKNKMNVAILDDGFQDLSVKKDLSIICFDEKQWVGNGLVIPAGPLREGLSSLKRANCIFINGSKNISIEEQILKKNKKIKFFYTKVEAQNINEFKNKNVVAFAGIGNPNNFFNVLKDHKINVLKEIKFPDHHKYSDKQLKELIQKKKVNNAILITTEKDYFRIKENFKEDINYLKIKVEIRNQDKFIEELKKII